MKERPVIFNAEMVRAILDGRKTQTRRIIKPQPDVTEQKLKEVGAWIEGMTLSEHVNSAWRQGFIDVQCPFGVIGDRLWVRETWCMSVNDDGHPINSNGELASNECAELFYRSTPPKNLDAKWVPSIHMPRWASRINLEITNVRVERLNDISNTDSLAEGIGHLYGYDEANGVPRDGSRHFAELWQSIYGEESWSSNPWVWVISFKQGGAA